MSLSVVAPAGSARLEKILGSSRLFGTLEPALIADLARRTTLRRCVRGDALWRTGEVATHFSVIQSGIVKIVRPMPGSADAIVALFGPRESIGDAAALQSSAYPADALVVSEHAEILRIEAALLLAAMRTRPEVATALNRALLAHTKALDEKIRIMSAGAVPRRLATLLTGLAERFGDEDEGGVVRIPLVISRGELACLIGARVETTIRTIRAWEKAGLVETLPEGFVLKSAAALTEATKDAAD